MIVRWGLAELPAVLGELGIGQPLLVARSDRGENGQRVGGFPDGAGLAASFCFQPLVPGHLGRAGRALAGGFGRGLVAEGVVFPPAAGE